MPCAFEAAARHRSVSRAAQELHVTHGAVSRQARAGRRPRPPLFEREGRGLRLTPAGENLRDAAGGAFAELARSWERLRRNAEAPLVLGCPGSLLARWVIPRLEKLQRQMPELRCIWPRTKASSPRPCPAWTPP
jgi:DNA-binding transcriptional LysR family regulator